MILVDPFSAERPILCISRPYIYSVLDEPGIHSLQVKASSVGGDRRARLREALLIDTVGIIGKLDQALEFPPKFTSLSKFGGKMVDPSKMNNSADAWKAYFSNWPDNLAKQGILVTNFDEQIPFAGFLTSDAFLLLDRKTPDSLGARTVVLPYDCVTALKVTEVVDQKIFRSIGFAGTLKKR